MMKLHETRRNMAEDSGPIFDHGGYQKWADDQLTYLVEGSDLREETLQERKEMVERRIARRNRERERPETSRKEEDEEEEDDF